MAYTPINWQTGDTITAEKMNKMDNGWGISSSPTTLCDETVTTDVDGDFNVAELTLSGEIEAESITVTYDSVVYICADDGGMYGAPEGDYSQYPFTIYSDGFMLCETSGTHTVKVEAVVTTVEVSPSFSSAVISTAPVFQIVINKTTWQEAHDAMASGKLCYYTSYVDGDVVEQFVALQALYDTEHEQYVIVAVGVPADTLAVKDVIFAFSSNGALLRN